MGLITLVSAARANPLLWKDRQLITLFFLLFLKILKHWNFQNGRQPRIFSKIEDDLEFFKTTSIKKMKDDYEYFLN